MRVHDYNPADGQAFQGDVTIVPIPSDIAIDTTDEISPVDGRLIVQEGELTGHHHAIRIPGMVEVPRFRDDAIARDLTSKSKQKVATARLYRDQNTAQEMVRRGVLARADLAVGCLVIEGGAMLLSHEEHDAIRIPVGSYLIGRQVESAGAEERRVAD